MTGTTVWLIRHGESVANAGAQTSDPAMIPLSGTGERQAAVVAEVLDQAPGLIVTSPFLRAQQTARATIERHPSVPVEEMPIQEFTYLGRLHGRPTTGAQREQLVEDYWNTADPSYVDDEKSESFVDVHARARQFLTRLTPLGGTVAAFTHGLFMRVVVWVLLTGETVPTTDSMRRFYRFRTSYRIPNCSIITLTLHPERDWHVLGGATTHLPAALRTGGR